MSEYDPTDWYWVVGFDTQRVWSSGRGEYVSLDDLAYQSFLGAGNLPSRIANGDELSEVLHNAGHSDGSPDTTLKQSIIRKKEAAARVRNNEPPSTLPALVEYVNDLRIAMGLES